MKYAYHHTSFADHTEKHRIHQHLRDYQIRAIAGIWHEWEKGNHSPVLQSPTGSGKSVMILAIAIDALLKGENVGLIIHKEELLQQWMKHFEHWLPGFHRGILGNKSRYGKLRDLKAPLQIMTVKTLHKLSDKPHLDLLIFDECHHIPAGEWMAVLKYYRENGIKRILGATATPIRLDGKGLHQLKEHGKSSFVDGFNALVAGPATKDLIKAGHLVPIDLYAGSVIVEASGMRIRNGEFKKSDADKKVREIVPVSNVVSEWERIAEGKMTIIYPVSVDYSMNLEQEFNSRYPGIAIHIDADTPSYKRDEALAGFASGKYKILLQHSIVIEGVDIPSVECVVCVRPTASISVWLQILGRGLRPAPDKSKMILIDFTDNHERLPMPDDEILWGLEGIKDIKKYELHFCPDCDKKRRFKLIAGGEGLPEKRICVKCGHQLVVAKEPNSSEIPAGRGPRKFQEVVKLLLHQSMEQDRAFTLAQIPDFSNYVEAPGGLEYNCLRFIIDIHVYRLRKGSKPFWGIFRIATAFDADDIKPTLEMYYYLFQAFVSSKCNSGEPFETFSPGNPNHIYRAKKGKEAFDWAISTAKNKGKTRNKYQPPPNLTSLFSYSN